MSALLHGAHISLVLHGAQIYSGLSDVFAREIVGHESTAISRQYTHLSTDDLRAAMRRVAGRDTYLKKPRKRRE